MDSSVVSWFVVFVREPPLPKFKSASKDCNVFAYYYLHNFNYYVRICVYVILCMAFFRA